MIDEYKFTTYDCETMKSCFSFGFFDEQTKNYIDFEISHRKNEAAALFKHLIHLKKMDHWLVGYNNCGFDGFVIDKFINMWMSGYRDPDLIRVKIHEYANSLIQDKNRFPKLKGFVHRQVDLMRIWHFDRMVRATSLKKIEAFLKFDDIQELPYAPDQYLDDDMIQNIMDYMHHDVKATTAFFNFKQTQKAIEVRKQAIDMFGEQAMNYSDTKIGGQYFVDKMLDEMGYDNVYKIVDGKREPIKTEYPDGFPAAPLIKPYITTKLPQMQAMIDFWKGRTIKETKGAFKDMKVSELGPLKNYVKVKYTQTEIYKKNARKFIDDGLTNVSLVMDKKGYPILPLGDDGKVHSDYTRMNTYRRKYWDHLHLDKDDYHELWRKFNKKKSEYVYCKETFEDPDVIEDLSIEMQNIRNVWGNGGNHAAIDPCILFDSTGEYVQLEVDANSMYPSIIVENYMSPKHANEGILVRTVQELLDIRAKYPKSDPRNFMAKLSNNSLFGLSNSEHSVLRDPALGMGITLLGQFCISMMSELLITEVPSYKLFVINTDSVFGAYKKEDQHLVDKAVKKFEETTRLQMGYTYVDKVLQNGCNHMIWKIKDEDEIKLKGMYNYNIEPHKDISSKVVKMAAEAWFIDDVDPETFIRNHALKSYDKQYDNPAYDFCITCKIPRSSRLVTRNVTIGGYEYDPKIGYEKLPGWRDATEYTIDTFNEPNSETDLSSTNRYFDWSNEQPQGRISRYIVSNDPNDPMLVKIMPPLESKPDNGERLMALSSGHHVTMCTNMSGFDWDKVNFDYYINETKKLIDLPRVDISEM